MNRDVLQSALALVNRFDAFRPCTTVQLTTSFLKPLSNQDALVQARLLRTGKALSAEGANEPQSMDATSSTAAAAVCHKLAEGAAVS